MSVDQASTETILSSLEAGKLAKPRMYNSLLERINAGEILSMKELETFDALDKELRQVYDGTRTEIPKPLQASEGPEEPEYFENLHAVVKYLEEKGYKIKKSQIYNHKTAGKIRPSRNGHYLLSDVEKYAVTHLRLADGTPPAGKQLDKAQHDRAEAETREKIARARHWELKTGTLEGKLVPREIFENELAARAAIFRTDGENFFHSQAPGMVHIVSGDATKIPDLLSFCLDALEQWISRYLQKEEFEVDTAAYERIFEEAGKDEADYDPDDPDDFNVPDAASPYNPDRPRNSNVPDEPHGPDRPHTAFTDAQGPT